jgi:hypothetical protein
MRATGTEHEAGTITITIGTASITATFAKNTTKWGRVASCRPVCQPASLYLSNPSRKQREELPHSATLTLSSSQLPA